MDEHRVPCGIVDYGEKTVDHCFVGQKPVGQTKTDVLNAGCTDRVAFCQDMTRSPARKLMTVRTPKSDRALMPSGPGCPPRNSHGVTRRKVWDGHTGIHWRAGIFCVKIRHRHEIVVFVYPVDSSVRQWLLSASAAREDLSYNLTQKEFVHKLFTDPRTIDHTIGCSC